MYVMDPREQLRIMDDIEGSGEDLLAIYHSHTRSAAYPSRTDVELAFFPDTLYLIVSIADRDAPEIRAFRISRAAAGRRADLRGARGDRVRRALAAILCACAVAPPSACGGSSGDDATEAATATAPPRPRRRRRRA